MEFQSNFGITVSYYLCPQISTGDVLVEPKRNQSEDHHKSKQDMKSAVPQ